jgi:hypothetical protein
VSYDTQGLPVTVPLPFSPSRPFNPLSALLPSSPLIADSGCTGLLLQLVNLPCLKPFFSPHPLPVVPFTLPDGSSLSAGVGLSHVTGFLTFPHKLNPVPCYFLPSSDLSHSLFGVSPLIRPSGHTIFTTTTCSFLDTPSSLTPFLTGTKAPLSDLWFLSLPDPQPLLESPSPSPSFTPSALFSLQSLPVARFVAYWHRCFGSPSLFTFKRALSRGFISVPHLTVKLVSRYPPLSLSTSFGHLDTLRKGIASSRRKIPESCLSSIIAVSPPSRTSSRLAASTSAFPPSATRSRTYARSEWTAADLTGRFPIPSHDGFEYTLVFLYCKYIHPFRSPQVSHFCLLCTCLSLCLCFLLFSLSSHHIYPNGQ